MTNFSFLKHGFPAIFADATEAEKHTLTAPKYAALLCRSALEKRFSGYTKTIPISRCLTTPIYLR